MTLFIHLYLLFAMACALPWILNWTTRGTIPVTVHLLAILIFLGTEFCMLWSLWQVHVLRPELMVVAVKLTAPILLGCFIGVWYTMGSLIRLMAKLAGRMQS